MFQTLAMLEVMNMILFLTLRNLLFEFVSYFDIRISDFVMIPTKIMPSELSSKPDPLDPVIYYS